MGARQDDPLSNERDVAALAGEVYREFYNKWRDHNRHVWAAHHWAARRTGLSLAIGEFVQPKWGPVTEEFVSETLERDAGDALDAVLKRAGMVVSPEVRQYLLRHVGKGVLLAMERISRECDGDYSPDPAQQRFPDFVAPKDVADRSPLAEFVFAAASKGWKPATVDKYRRIFNDFLGQLPGYGLRKDKRKDDWDLRIIERAHVRAWVDGLLTREDIQANARTVEREYLGCIKAIFGFAKGNDRLPTNPAEGIRIHEARQVKGRKMRGFDEGEASAILAETLLPQGDRPSRKTLAARRWGPWLCAYTGARIVEIMQMRGKDIRKRDGPWCVFITPEAGTEKNGGERDVPLHEHLIAQGFVEFARLHRPDEPLFHNYEPNDPDQMPPGVDLAACVGIKTVGDYHRMRAAKAAQSVGGNISKWVREMGVLNPDDPVNPNHGWRHYFKSKGLALELKEVVLDGIQGHAAPGAAGRYKHFAPQTMMTEIVKMPRIAVDAEPWMANPPAHPWLPPNYAQALDGAVKAPTRAKRAG